MKKIYFLFVLIFVTQASIAQIITQLNQSFTAPFNFTNSTNQGWYIRNNSVPLGFQPWGSGSPTVFPAYSGGPSDYIFANYNSQGTGAGNISNFLITPTVTIIDGAILEFATRTQTNPTQFPDRLQLLMSYGTGTGSIGTGTAAVGTFTDLIDDLNPFLTTTGYPGNWTVYSYTMAGITNPGPGRFAFRYFVSDGGPNGANSDYIGIDDVNYFVPCNAPTLTITPSTTVVCNQGSVSLSVTGANNYTWSTGATNSVLTVSLNQTKTYTVSGIGTVPGCKGTASITINVVSSPTLSASDATACLGGVATLTASGASTYSWSNGSTGSSITVNAVGAVTTVTVIGYNAPNCFDTKAVSITTNTFLNVPNTNIVACPNQITFLGASGAASYNWSTGATTPSITITPTANASYVVSGSDGICTESKVINVTIDPNLFAPSFTVCSGISATLIATGATFYNWSTGSTASMVVVSPSATTVYTVTGMSGSCSQTKTLSVSLGNKLSIVATQSCSGTSAILSAYGANSYTWLPMNDHNQTVIVNASSSTIYTLQGSAGTCNGSAIIQVSQCVGFEEWTENEQMKVYPNPFGNELTLTGAYGDVHIYNILAKEVMKDRAEGTMVIPTESFEPGIYFVIVTNSQTAERKVIKVIKN